MAKLRVMTLMLTLVFVMPSAAPTGEATHAQADQAGAESTSKFHRVANAIPGSYLVGLDSATNKEDVAMIGESLKATYGGTVTSVWTDVVKGFCVKTSEPLAIALSLDPRVACVEEDSAGTVVGQRSADWGLSRIDQRNLPVDNFFNYTNTGAGVTVYIIDTGIRRTHNDFRTPAGGPSRVSTTAFFDAFPGQTPSLADCDVAVDPHGHGTPVASIAAGRDHGVAENATIVNVRVVGCSGTGSDIAASAFIDGVHWVTDNHQAGTPAVANVSLEYSLSYLVDQAVRDSIADGITYVISAGNDGQSPNTPDRNAINHSPQRVIEAITVAASTRTANLTQDTRSDYSNYGKIVDVFAPGDFVTVASKTGDSGIATLSGTSMSAPYVTGAVADYLQSNPTASPQAVRNVIKNKATDGVMVATGSTNTPNRVIYSKFNMTSQPVAPLCDPKEQSLCTKQGGTWNATTCTCTVPPNPGPVPCPEPDCN